jgi:hypothetical protein
MKYPLYQKRIFFGWLFLFLNSNIVKEDKDIKEITKRLKFVKGALADRIYFRSSNCYQDGDENAVTR